MLARRQPGSTLKPFLYALAIERRLLTPASLLDDSPAQIAAGSGLYVPQNYDQRFKGLVSARTALGAQPQRAGGAGGALLGPDALFARAERARAAAAARTPATTAMRSRSAAPRSRCCS